MDEAIVKKVKRAIMEKSKEGRISCHDAWYLSEAVQVPRKVVGDACTDMGVKIHSCQLGCF